MYPNGVRLKEKEQKDQNGQFLVGSVFGKRTHVRR